MSILVKAQSNQIDGIPSTGYYTAVSGLGVCLVHRSTTWPWGKRFVAQPMEGRRLSLCYQAQVRLN